MDSQLPDLLGKQYRKLYCNSERFEIKCLLAMLRLGLISQQLFLSTSEYYAVANSWKKDEIQLTALGVSL